MNRGSCVDKNASALLHASRARSRLTIANCETVALPAKTSLRVQALVTSENAPAAYLTDQSWRALIE